MKHSAYQVLEVSPRASSRDIQLAYRKLVAKHHPDRYAVESRQWKAAHAATMEINEAYRVLKDPQRRSAYDAEQGFDLMAAPGAAEEARPRTTDDFRPRSQPSGPDADWIRFVGEQRRSEGTPQLQLVIPVASALSVTAILLFLITSGFPAAFFILFLGALMLIGLAVSLLRSQ